MLQAKCADEVFGMELPEHRRYAATGDGLRAAGAKRSALSMIVRLAVRHSLVVKEGAAVEGLPAILQFETIKRHVEE